MKPMLTTRMENGKQYRYILLWSLLLFTFSSCTSIRYAGVNRIRNYEICSRDLPLAFDGYRIAFASDFHLESKFKERQLRGTVKALQMLDPDVLFLHINFLGQMYLV